MPARFFNAHCHLELSFMKGKIKSGLPFSLWLEEVVALKRAASTSTIERAVRESLDLFSQEGTEALLDIDSLGLTPKVWKQVPSIKGIVFREALGFKPPDGIRLANDTLKKQSADHPLPSHLLDGISPHAPYTTTIPLNRSLASRARLHQQWLCVHAAETEDETEMFLRNRGDLREFLDPFLPADWECPRVRPLEWLDLCDCLTPQTLLVHCNDVTDSDLQLIRARQCRVVICPGTHLYFNRGEFPLEKLLKYGIPTYIGTDSLASNDQLSMEREVTLAKELSPGVSPELVESLASIKRASDFGLMSPARNSR